MKWFKIILFIAVVLLIVDSFLGINIYRQYYVYSRLDTAAVKDTIELLGESGIKITEKVIGRDKPDLKLYEYEFSDKPEEYYESSAMFISGITVADSLISHMINNGIKIIADGDIYEFYDTGVFSMKFIAEGFEEAADKYLLDREDAQSLFTSETDLFDDYKTMIENRICAKSQSGFGGNPRMGVKIDAIYKDSESGIAAVYFTQTVSETKIHGFNAEAVIADGGIVCISGNLIINGEGKSYSPKLYDQLNILFCELADYEDADTETQITALDSVYTLSWNAEMTRYYMIPSWSFDYNGKYTHIRNMINGDIYLE